MEVGHVEWMWRGWMWGGMIESGCTWRAWSVEFMEGDVENVEGGCEMNVVRVEVVCVKVVGIWERNSYFSAKN